MEDILHKVSSGLKEYAYGIEFKSMGSYSNDPVFEKEMLAIQNRFNKKQKNLSLLASDIKKLIAQYPHALPLKNSLYCAYMEAGDEEKAEEILNKTITEHPDYLFAYINKAGLHIMKGEFEKVPEVLGNMLELGELFPNRDKFHISEFLGFSKIVALYACGVNNLELAENRLEIMQKIGPDFPDTKQVLNAVIQERVKSSMARMQKSNEMMADYNQIPDDYLSLPQTDEPPHFHHTETEQLYHAGLDIDLEILAQILLLPRETLIKDLETVIYDGIKRFTYHSSNGFIEEKHNFVIHAMILLVELKAEEALPILLEILRQGENYLEFWFGDLLTDTIWEVYYQLFDLNQYLQYLKEPRNYTFAKTMISETFLQKFKGDDFQRHEIINIYQSLLQYFIENCHDADILDANLVGRLITDTAELQLIELLPIAKVCFGLDMVDTWVGGNYKAIEEAARTGKFSDDGQELTLAQGYKYFYASLQEWLKTDEVEDSDFADDDDYDLQETKYEVKNDTAIAAGLLTFNKPNIGRNDLCVCGSGKKFKKCCIDKYEQ